MFITFLLFFSRIETLALIFVYYMLTQSIQKQVVEYNVKSKYPEEDSTIDRVGCEKLTFSEEILFHVELIDSSFVISLISVLEINFWVGIPQD